MLGPPFSGGKVVFGGPGSLDRSQISISPSSWFQGPSTSSEALKPEDYGQGSKVCPKCGQGTEMCQDHCTALLRRGLCCLLPLQKRGKQDPT